ncbi:MULTISPECIES: type IV secretory system conjugative DNA transfer family protein [Prauserella salsuginis group]|uniref:Type IV secretory system conjugative DNA transfer family protein n=1 Tax=Prauserella salsuginis TaxID=387889 RepID=A0ABW6FW10_9PSEU|nr:MULTISPECIES: TraM recognition domain-containing protein [Prauserella salsuginis group]MCR3720168.1 TraM recognition site of TraD and TraG [Prauserella flava]MCR3734123.1 TraM recognition site of TraD and TraG [Prauserella salsuginis]
MSLGTRKSRAKFTRRVVAGGVALFGLGWLMSRMPAETPGQEFWPWLMIAGALPLVTVVVLVARRRTGTVGTVSRWSRRSKRNDGVASPWTILRTASWFAVRRKAAVLRPHLRQMSWWRRWTVPITELATPLARVGPLRVWSPIEDVTLRLGGPRTGKTGELAGRILDAPGAVIATSTRTDLVELTGACRARTGPVSVFNPSGLGGMESSVTFDPLSGCEEPKTATVRAADLLSGAATSVGGGDMEFWQSQARRVLASLMHAAALGGGSMRDVLAWVADPDNAGTEVQRFLRRSPEPAFEQDALQFLGTNERTRSSICSTIMPALGWLTDATASAAAAEGSFDVAELLAGRGTVFMLGAEDSQVAPLVTALTGHIAREARRLAAFEPGGRLDPPLTMALDEAALICPVPLDNWTADMGGRNVTIHIAAQSRSQLRQRWGDDGAATILNNSAALMIYGATRDSEDLAAYSALAGERYEETPTWDEDGELKSVSSQRVPVLTQSQIAQLPPGRVLMIRRNMPAAVGRVRMAWKRHDVRAETRAARRYERLTRWSEAWLRFADRVEEWASQDKFAKARRKLGVHLDVDRARGPQHVHSDVDGGVSR